MNDDIVLYTRPDCGVCDEAKRYLQQQDRSYQTYVIGQDCTRDDVLSKIPIDARTRPIMLPVCFIGAQYIGGYSELIQYIERKSIVRNNNGN